MNKFIGNVTENRKYLINRIGYFRVRAKMSARELSFRLGKSSGYITKFELGGINLPADILFDIFEILHISGEEFFSKDPEKFIEDKKFLVKFHSLSTENQELILKLMDSLR